MAFENTLQAISAYNRSLKGGQLVDENHLSFVLNIMFTDIQTEVTGSSENSLSLTGGTLEGLVEYDADYSGTYTNRSLVDKEYVDTAIQTAIDVLP